MPADYLAEDRSERCLAALLALIRERGTDAVRDHRGCARTYQPSAVNCRRAPQSPSVEMEHVTDRTSPWAHSWYRKDFALAWHTILAGCGFSNLDTSSGSSNSLLSANECDISATLREMREARPYMGIFLPSGTGERSRSIGGLTRRVICGRE
jgi:hypothetical protein